MIWPAHGLNVRCKLGAAVRASPETLNAIRKRARKAARPSTSKSLVTVYSSLSKLQVDTGNVWKSSMLSGGRLRYGSHGLTLIAVFLGPRSHDQHPHIRCSDALCSPRAQALEPRWAASPTLRCTEVQSECCETLSRQSPELLFSVFIDRGLHGVCF